METSSIRIGTRSNSGEVNPRKQRGATFAIGDDSGYVVIQE